MFDRESHSSRLYTQAVPGPEASLAKPTERSLKTLAMSIYRIRILGPWKAHVSPTNTGETRENLWSGTIAPPSPFPAVEHCQGRSLSLERVFHPPTNLTGKEQLRLVLPGLSPLFTVLLNGTSLVRDVNSREDWQGEIPHALQTNNRLTVTCPWDTREEMTLPPLFQGAILEIHEDPA